MSSRPNIICFVTDQQRADHLGAYGNRQIRTPNIDRIAAEGVTFTESYVGNPVCMPNRACMFTGRYPKAHGLRENGLALRSSEIVLPEVLRQSGYHTRSIGKIHLSPFQVNPEITTNPAELCESGWYWNNHADGSLPLPYYGLDDVCLVNGHGSYAFGHYRQWLDKEHPGAHDKLKKANALEPPTCPREWWKASIPEELHYNTFIADRTIDFLRARDRDKPFFLWCSFPDPHHPYSPPRPWCDMYDPTDIDFAPPRRDGEFEDLPDYFAKAFRGEVSTGGLAGDLRGLTDDHHRQIHAHTYGMISMVDAQVGRIMDCLRETGIQDDTIVVFFSDHGDLMGDHWLINKGPYLFRGLVRVPTIWRVPGVSGGHTSDALISTVDLMPTLLDLAGADIPEGVQGLSCRPLLTGKSDRVRDWAYIEYDEDYLKDRLRQIRSHDWAITAYSNSSHGLLFDLRDDPNELHNLWNSAAHKSIKNELLAELFTQTSRADDWLPHKLAHA